MIELCHQRSIVEIPETIGATDPSGHGHDLTMGSIPTEAETLLIPDKVAPMSTAKCVLLAVCCILDGYYERN
jgi:hypothetical protein